MTPFFSNSIEVVRRRFGFADIYPEDVKEEQMEAELKPKGARVEVVAVKRRKKTKSGVTNRKEYIVRVYAANGRQIGGSGESYARRDHALRQAGQIAREKNVPLYVEGKNFGIQASDGPAAAARLVD